MSLRSLESFIKDRWQNTRGMSLRDYFAAHLPAPTDAEIKEVADSEQLANPHGDSYKPRRHSWREIKAALRYRNADDLLKARKGE